MKYFHIDTQSQHRIQWSQFRLGEELSVGHTINPIYTNWKNSATRAQHGLTTEDVNRSVAVMLRELVFENVRAKEFPTLPSRTNCIWLLDSETAIEYWLHRIPHHGEKRVLEIEILDGVLHKAYEEHLTNNLENISELEARAHKYWSGKGSGQSETLFQGRFVATLKT